MSAIDPRFTQEHQDACSRRLDASLRPINDAALARRGLTRAQLLATVAATTPPSIGEADAGQCSRAAASSAQTAPTGEHAAYPTALGRGTPTHGAGATVGEAVAARGAVGPAKAGRNTTTAGGQGAAREYADRASVGMLPLAAFGPEGAK